MKQLSKKKVKDRRKVGIVKAYMSRAAAIKKLQLPLADFRRLCILKGVYPVEPKNKSKLTGGNTRRKTYFFARDVQYLMNEPILQSFWDFKVFMKRLTKAKGRHDLEKFNQVNENKPIYQLDHVVKERYPRFIDALRDCDDALSMCFLFAMFPKGRATTDDLVDLSRKLTVEFMHYVINSRTLRKVFISIKGYYYQAEIMGQTITWMVPHQFVIDSITTVDMNVMKTFTEFYVTLLGFINYKLFKSINAVYPPQYINERKVEDEDSRETLNKKIRITGNKLLDNEQEPDLFEDAEADKEKVKDGGGGLSFQQILALEKLFEGLKFFINREAPIESLTFIIRSFGGEVTLNEADPTITHQIVDRASVDKRRLDRVYIQPQWAYDSINARKVLPTEDYLLGAKLPPHLSPFFSAPSDKTATKTAADDKEASKKNDPTSTRPARVKKGKMAVKQGKAVVESKEELAKREELEHRKMGIMMIPKKKKRLFDKIMKTKKDRTRKEDKLQKKRKIVEAVTKKSNKKGVRSQGR